MLTLILFAAVVFALVASVRPMAAQSTKMMNLVEWSQHFHRGKILPEIAMLAQENQVVMDIPWAQCNDGTTHLYRQTTALPTVHLTAFGEGTPESKSQSALERESCTLLTGFSTVPEQTARVHGGQGAVRAEEDANFSEAMKQAFARRILYGNRAADLKDIFGFMTRFNALGGVKAKNVLSCGGNAANAQTSILLVNWGKDVFGIFPEGTTAGYVRNPLGKQVKTLPNGNQLVVLQTEHLWHIGLCLRAWTSVVRICNIQVADALNLANNQAPSSVNNVLHKMILARRRIRRPGTKVFYANETIFGLMMRIALEKSNAALSVQKAITQFGEFEELRFLGTPVRLCDQILDTEAVVA